METPKSKRNLQSATFGTPLTLPCSPLLKRLGYGTGVQVFRMERSPDPSGAVKSPWALKCISKYQPERSAAKVISKRLLQEADILKKLNHPNVIGFRGFKKLSDGRETLLLEECTISLGDLLEERHEKKSGPLPAVQIRKMCTDVTGALDYLHNEARLLHGDMKSFNILIKKDFEICKVCDFGCSLPLNDEGYVDTIKQPDASYVGTSVWCAPEVLLEDVVVISSKADIFSFGLAIYECIACIPPHTFIDDEIDECENNDDSEIADIDDVIGTRPSLPVDFDVNVEYNNLIEIFYVCTNESPEDRPTAKSLNTALQML